MNQQKIGKFIQERRKEKKLTQVELAEKLGVSNRTISKWENGNSLPDYSIFQDLCNELDISINELLSGEKLTEENYQKKLEENIVSTIDYNNKKRNKKIKNAIIIFIVFVILYLFYKLFLIAYYDTRIVSEDNSRDFPFYKNISSLSIRTNNLANKTFSEYVPISLYIPDEFELVTDKAKSNMVMNDCDVYIKNLIEGDLYDAAVLVCNRAFDNTGNLDYFGIDSTLFPFLDVHSTLEKYNIHDTIDLIHYYENHYQDKYNVFTESSKIKILFIARQYCQMTLPNYDNFYYLENDLRGYTIEYSVHNKKKYFREATFYYPVDAYNVASYSISFFNGQEEYFNQDNTLEIVSSISKR